ncbi:hypothetical protein HAX54_019468 [Datura stramonium]|uniref:K-box domain-containing protein n=1 Tax=Datura stramonium TaxID=4076 RepID=A0ABS8URL4_DATST|nr:hypothetical protein [Datura stramonium]
MTVASWKSAFPSRKIQSSHRFPYGYLDTTSPQSKTPPCMLELIEKQKMHSEWDVKNDVEHQQSPHLQNENATYAKLSREFLEKNLELRQLMGEELQRLEMEELMKLEKLVERGISRVLKVKGDKFMKEISSLKKKESQLKEENAQLKQQSGGQLNTVEERPHVTTSITNPCFLINHFQDTDNSDTSLKLGLPFPNRT